MNKLHPNTTMPVLKIAFLDVGQADTIVISCPSTREAVVVDCVDAKGVLDYHSQENIETLRGIIITHLHEDHYSGVASLLHNSSTVPNMKECEVVAFNDIFNKRMLKQLINDEDGHALGVIEDKDAGRRLRSHLQDIIEWRKKNKLKYATMKLEHRSLPISGSLSSSIQLLHPYAVDFADLEVRGVNNTSVILRIVGSGSSALLTGDIEPEGWKRLRENEERIRSDVLKFPHHGAWKGADVDVFLDDVMPSIVVISVGTEGYAQYNHPNPHVFKALRDRKDMRLLCTQATDQCQVSVMNKRNAVIEKLKHRNIGDGRVIPVNLRGCPCAGTVLIELGDVARVIQPDLTFHRENIILAHFQAHKCNLDRTIKEDQTEVVQKIFEN